MGRFSVYGPLICIGCREVSYWLDDRSVGGQPTCDCCGYALTEERFLYLALAQAFAGAMNESEQRSRLDLRESLGQSAQERGERAAFTIPPFGGNSKQGEKQIGG